MLRLHIYIKSFKEWNFIESYIIRIQDIVEKIYLFYNKDTMNDLELSFSESWGKDLITSEPVEYKHPHESFFHFLEETDLDDNHWVVNLHCHDENKKEFYQKIYEIMFPISKDIRQNLVQKIENDADIVGAHTFPYDYYSIKEDLSLLSILGIHPETLWKEFDKTFPQWKNATVFEKIVLSAQNKYKHVPVIDTKLYQSLFSEDSPLSYTMKYNIMSQFINPETCIFFYYPELLIFSRFRVWKSIFHKKLGNHPIQDWNSLERVFIIACIMKNKRLKVISAKEEEKPSIE